MAGWLRRRCFLYATVWVEWRVARGEGLAAFRMHTGQDSSPLTADDRMALPTGRAFPSVAGDRDSRSDDKQFQSSHSVNKGRTRSSYRRNGYIKTCGARDLARTCDAPKIRAPAHSITQPQSCTILLVLTSHLTLTLGYPKKFEQISTGRTRNLRTESGSVKTFLKKALDFHTQKEENYTCRETR